MAMDFFSEKHYSRFWGSILLNIEKYLLYERNILFLNGFWIKYTVEHEHEHANAPKNKVVCNINGQI